MKKEKQYISINKNNFKYQNKAIYYKYIFMIILFLSLFEPYILFPTFIYSRAISLLNKNFFIIHKYGIDIYDTSLSSKIKNILVFNNDELINTTEKYTKTTLTQFNKTNKNDKIISIINDKIYIFNNEGELLYNSDNKIEDFKGKYYNLLVMKNNNNRCFYMTSFVDENDFIQVLFFEYDESSNTNYLMHKIPEFNYINDDGGYFLIKNKCLTCQLMRTDSQSNISICFYCVDTDTSNFILSYSLINTDTYSFIESIKTKEIIIHNEENDIISIKSVINSDNSKIFICLYTSFGHFYFFIYSILANSISKYKEFFANCKSNNCDVEFNYINENNLILFSFPDNEEIIHIMLFNNTFENINNYTINNYLYNFSYSILYSFFGKSYYIISDQSYEELQTLSQKNNSLKDKIDKSSSSNQLQLRQMNEDISFKCSIKTNESIAKGLCIECNNENNFYSIHPKFLKNNQTFVECYNISTKPKNVYLNDKYYEPCYMSCATCDYGGNGIQHNCTSCATDYTKEPGNNTNCVIKCKNLYYYTSYGQYKCSSNMQCPQDKNLLIRIKNKCVDSCLTDDTYQYQYNGECLDKCPDGTRLDNKTKICLIKNNNICTNSSTKFDLYDFLKEGGVENIAKTYAKEFEYTSKHISIFKNEVYSIMLYRKTECITELKLPMPEIDFGTCYKKVQDHHKIKDSLIIAIIDKKSNKKSNPITSYSFYDPTTGEKLDSEDVCKEDVIIVKENIKSILNDSVTNMDSLLFLTGQNIDIFNKSSGFYHDICYHFESPCDKDVALNDRLLIYYPNITLCDSGCTNNGVNLTSMTAICECKFKAMTDEETEDNENIYQIAVNEFYFFLNQINLAIMACYQELFVYKYFIKNTGGIIIICLMIVQFADYIIYYFISFFSVKKYIYNITDNYFLYLNKSPLYKPFINKVEEGSVQENKKSIKNRPRVKNKNFPPKKNQSYEDINLNRNNKRNHNSKGRKIDNHKISIGTKEFTEEKSNSSKIILCGPKLFTKKKRTKSNSITSNITNLKLEKSSNSFKSIEKINTNPLTNSPNKNKKTFYEEYLSTELNEMLFGDALIEDKRLFFDFFCDELKKKQLMLDLLLLEDPLKPKTLKLLLIILDIEVCFVINAMFINEDYISKLFKSEKEENFFSFLPRSINRSIYTIIASILISLIISCFFIPERRLKAIFRYEQNNANAIKYEINLLMKEMKWRNNIFILLTVVASVFSWYYISCFNNIYPHTKIEWIKSSIVIILLVQIFSIFTTFVETLLRFVSFEIKNEKMYRASQWLG